MSAAKKIQTVFDDQINAKIQQKFDLVFDGKNSDSSMDMHDDSIAFNNEMDEEFVMEKNGKNSGNKDDSAATSSSINLDFSADDDSANSPASPVAQASSSSKSHGADIGLDFDLDFGMDAEVESTPSTPAAFNEDNEDNDEAVGFTLDESDIGSDDISFDEATKKTIVVNREQLTKSNLENFSLDLADNSVNSTADMMTTEEAKANIESTIKDILRPKIEGTKEINLGKLESSADMSDIEDSELTFREGTPSKGFALDDIMDENDFSVDTKPALKKPTSLTNESSTEFDLGDLDTSFDADENDVDDASSQMIAATPRPNVKELKKEVYHSRTSESSSYDSAPSMGMGGSNITNEDSMRFQATIRALREEREEMLQQIKNLKTDSKDLEQDNLTLKANLDEAKIEITILRKRHMVELEDIKYRLAMSEEKKSMADEKARQADLRREKLEQKVRIDFNQVKQREKELESKLELLSMDVDSQVQSRDHKILELRRKIDALEFNMENASIKEQKSLDDKRKLEDRLNKIMKTLRHSIKNLEDDIDHAHDEDDHQKGKN